jgi:hypothetical protein
MWAPRGLSPMRLTKIQKGITSNPELVFEHGDSGWKALEDKKVMETWII